MKLLGLCLTMCASLLFPSAPSALGKSTACPSTVVQIATASAAASPAGSDQARVTLEFRMSTVNEVDYSEKITSITSSATKEWVKKTTKFEPFLNNTVLFKGGFSFKSTGENTKIMEEVCITHSVPINMRLLVELLRMEEWALAQHLCTLMNAAKEKGVIIAGVEQLSRGGAMRCDYTMSAIPFASVDNKSSGQDQKSK